MTSPATQAAKRTELLERFVHGFMVRVGLTREKTEAKADLFDYIERFHNPRMQRRLDARAQAFRLLTQQSMETG